MAPQQTSSKPRKKGPKLTKDGKITVFDAEDSSYGIRELIELIRFIPEGQDVFFGAEMIKKTLASMQLSIHDIMQDGVEKRKLAAKTIQHLVAEISDYQRRIQSLKSHIRHLRFELGEIQDTCHYLLSDDVDLSQYQPILDEVARSPIEGDEDHESLPKPEQAPIQANEEQASQETTSNAHASDQFVHTETLVESNKVTDNGFVPDALTNPDEEYTKSETPALSNLTDEVFNPDRFDDQNGLSSPIEPPAQAQSALQDDTATPPALDPFLEEITPTDEPVSKITQDNIADVTLEDQATNHEALETPAKDSQITDEVTHTADAVSKNDALAMTKDDDFTQRL